MSNKQITLIEGDVEIVAAEDTAIYGTGNLTIAGNLFVGGVLSFSNLVGIIKDTKSIGTNGGTFVKDIWVQRDLNTLEGNANTRVSISSNTFTLQPGKYNIQASVPAYLVNNNQARLYNITDNIVSSVGTSEIAYTNASVCSKINCYIDISLAKTFRLEHRCDTTNNNDGFGVAAGLTNEIYTTIIVYVLN